MAILGSRKNGIEDGFEYMNHKNCEPGNCRAHQHDRCPEQVHPEEKAVAAFVKIVEEKYGAVSSEMIAKFKEELRK